MEDGKLLEEIGQILRKSRGEPSKLIELITCILKLNRGGKISSCPKVLRKLWPEQWQQAENKVEFEITKWDLLRRRRREINERVFHSHMCFGFFVELSQKKQFHIITDPKEIFHKRLKELERNLAKAKPKINREKIRAQIIELTDKFQEFAKEKTEVVNDQPPAIKISDKLSIAVLPFVSMSGYPGQKYFSDGVTENIITALSKIPKTLVISPNPAFSYKDNPAKLQQAIQESGARYVLKGTVQKIDNRVRISTQLMDVNAGHYLWAERWDRDLKDIFALQDEISIRIVEAVQSILTEGAQSLIQAKGTDNIEAYIKVLQARYYLRLMTVEGNTQARRLAKQVIALDPEYPTGYTLLGNAYLGNLYLGATNDWSQTADQAFRLSQKALGLDDSNCYAYILLGMVYQCRKQHEEAIAAIKRSVALNPDSTICLEELAVSLTLAGSPEEALPLLQKSLRLNHVPNIKIFFTLGMTYKSLERYEEAIAAFKEVTRIQPNHSPALFHLGISYCALGHKHEARAAIAEALKINPNHTLEKEKYIIGLLHKDPAYRARSIDLLHKAGLQ